MRELEWGETPWDGMTREQLLREVQRMYSALTSARSALRLIRHNDRGSPFWGSEGSGGLAIGKADQIVAAVETDHDAESVYRAFFRYADDLLFDGLGSDWRICEQGHMTAAPDRSPPTECALCRYEGRTATVRPLAWSDLARRPVVTAPSPTGGEGGR